ncbi:MAG TPA: hypothetical protein VK743_10845 [Steroidobacteraceae bacterium]|jgi:hypothetical protein|nr:hypothetical protein [Steroidobacteraceae bacterium]
MARHHDPGFPLLIGVCGHRSFDPSCATELATAVRSQLLRLAIALPSTEIRVLSGMATGTDLIVARAAIEAGVQVEAVLPMPLTQYRADFDSDSYRELSTLLAHQQVRCVELTPPERLDEPGGRDKGYQSLGRMLIRRSSILLAVWDGKSTRLPGGCFDTLIRYLDCHGGDEEEFIEPVFIPASDAEPGDAVVYWIPVRPAGDDARRDVPKACFLTAVGHRLAVHAELPISVADEWRELDSLNHKYRSLARNCDRQSQNSLISSLPPDLKFPDVELLHDIDARYSIADSLAMHYQLRSDGLFQLFGALTLLAGGSFLVYELLIDSRWLLVIYLVALAIGLTLFRILSRNHWLSGHLACRTLAESLRVKFYLVLAGADHLVDIRELISISGINLFDGFGWFRHVLRSVERTDAVGAGGLTHGAATEAAVEHAWINDQHAYFTREVKRFSHIKHREAHYKRTMFAVTLIAIVGLVFYGEEMEHIRYLVPVPVKDLVMFVWGSLTVVLGVWKLHQDKMATRELLWQYRAQLRHFAQARAQLKMATGMSDRLKVIVQLGRESLMESYLWAIHRFHREHEPPTRN